MNKDEEQRRNEEKQKAFLEAIAERRKEMKPRTTNKLWDNYSDMNGQDIYWSQCVNKQK